MPSEYLPIAILVVLATALALLVVILGAIFGPHTQTEVKSEPYESGMNPIGPGRRRVPVHFYLVAVLFILFDVEIIFLLPWASVLRELDVFGLVEMFVFIGILIVGFAYAWKKGALEWD
jgi:NADH-quinone oxidoreductase subunit A